MHWKPLKDKRVQCQLCNRNCILSPGQTGVCNVRQNIDGKLYTLVYGDVVSYALDPIEKKPLFHFLPGTSAFSIATVGCNFKCVWCQNWEISQARPGDVPTVQLMPEDVVSLAKRSGASTVAYTYVEPTIFYELAYDTSKLAVEHGLANVFVTNGYMTKKALKAISPYLHGMNIDIKGSEDMYLKYMGGVHLKPVLDIVKYAKKLGIWVEVTNLLIPGLNDDEATIESIIDFVKSVDRDMPLHFTAFHPDYRMRDRQPTPRETLVEARKKALEEGLHHVYIGNVAPGDPYENTYCPKCGELLIERFGFTVTRLNITSDGRCPKCGAKVAGIWGPEYLKMEKGEQNHNDQAR